jgi:hypothetical protein
MSLGPIDDWREYDWRIADVGAVVAPGFTFSQKGARIWRVTMRGGAAGGQVSYSGSGIVNVPQDVVIVVEPRGMWVNPITFTNVAAQVEWIRRINNL